jgi:NAD(P)-dependent dehydrogenase (short-subunit alcohol dehydrogenase family)
MSDDTLKPALVTGASRGLGAACAEYLARSRHVIAVARTTGALEELDDRIQAAGGSATLAPMDVTDPGAMAHLCRSTWDRWGGLSIWVHTACHAPPLAPADHVDAKDWSKTMAVLGTATSTLIPMVAPLLRDAGAQAVFFSDADDQGKFFGAYAAGKAAQMALARARQAETARTGPHVHVLAPAPMPTATRARFFPGEDRSTLADPAAEAARLLGGLV